MALGTKRSEPWFVVESRLTLMREDLLDIIEILQKEKCGPHSGGPDAGEAIVKLLDAAEKIDEAHNAM